MFRYIFAAALLGLSVSRSNAQQVVNVEILKDDIKGLNFFKVRLPLWELSGSKMNTSIYDANAGLFLHLGDKFIFTADYSYGLLDRIAPDTEDDLEYINNDNMTSVNKNTHATYGGGSVTWFFKEKATEESIQVNLKQSKSRSANAVHYVMVPGTILKRWGLKLGYTQGITWYCMNDMAVNMKPYDDPDRNMQSFISNSNSTMMKYGNLSLGISIAKSTNIWIDAEGYGIRGNSDIGITTFDILFAVQNELDDVYATIGTTAPMNGLGNQTLVYQRFNINDYNKKLRFGFNFGYRYIPFDSIFSFTFDAGYAPGLLNNINAYVKAGICMYLGNKARPKVEKQI